MSPTNYNSDIGMARSFSANVLQYRRAHKPEGVLEFLWSLSISHWLLLAFPVIMVAIQRRRDPSEAFVVDTAALVQIGYTLLCFSYLLFRLHRFGRSIQAVAKRAPIHWMVLFAFLSLLSTAWSDFPKPTAFRAFQYLVLTGLVIVSVIQLRTVERIAKFLLIYGLFVFFIFQLSSFRYTLSISALRSPLVTQTTGMLIFLALMLNGKGWRLLFFVMCFSVVFGRSGATNVSVVAALFMLPIAGCQPKYRGIGTLLILLIAIIAVTNLDQITGALFPGKSMGEINTLTGRLPMWEWFFREAFPQRPFLGYGFGVGESIARLDNFTGLRATHMHNILVSALANLGLAGGFITSLLIGSALRIAVTLKNPRQRGFICAATVAVILNSFSLVSVTSPLSLGWISSALMLGLLTMSRFEQTSSIRVQVVRQQHLRPVSVPRYRKMTEESGSRTQA